MSEIQTVKRESIKDNNKPSLIFSAKLIQLTRWEHIDEVNSQLDMGTNPYTVHKWILKQGFRISSVLVYNYAELRKRSLAENISMERLLGVVRNPILNTQLESKKTAKDKLKSELDALDLIIQKGFENLNNNKEKINAGTMMAAIKLKNDLTEGTHGFLTNYGMEQLREIETNKYYLIVKHLLSYIPQELHAEAMKTMAEVEERYYYNTDYYEEYLRAVGGLSEDKIQLKLERWKNDILKETKDHMDYMQSWRSY